VRSIVLAVVLGLMASVAVAQDWGKVATVSSTMGVSANQLCLGEASRGDIGCPAYAPSVNTAGNMIVSGSVTAASFVGDGSGLTNVGAATTDRIVSGSTSMLAISTTGYISITQAGTNTGWFDPTRGLVTIGISSTGPISATSLYLTSSTLGGITLDGATSWRLRNTGGQIFFDSTLNPGAIVLGGNSIYWRSNGVGNVGIGIGTTPSATLHVSGSLMVTSGSTTAPTLSVDSVNNTVSVRSTSTSIATLFVNGTIGTNTKLEFLPPVVTGTWMYMNAPSSGVLNLGSVNGATLVTLTNAPNATFQVAAAARITSWTGINLSDTTIPPTAPLEVSGTVSATRFVGAFVGDGSGLTNVGAATTDRIVSGTTSMLAISTTGYISLTQAGTNTGWFDPTRGLVTIGVSSTGPISGTSGYFSGSVAIGASPTPTFALSTGLLLSSNLTLNRFSAEYMSYNVFWNGSNWEYFNSDYASTWRGNSIGGLEYWTAPSATALTSATLTPRFVIGNSGNVGIGTAGSVNPSATLHVSGTAIIQGWTAMGFNNNHVPAVPLEVSGTVSATQFSGAFVGDGSGLTNIAGASADRIVSGTTKMLAVSNTGYISITQAGTNTGWFDPTLGLVTIGVSSTGTVSATSGFFTNAIYQQQLRFGLPGTTGGSLGADLNSFFYLTGATGGALTVGGNEKLRVSVNGVGIGAVFNPSATLHVSGSLMVTSGSIGAPTLYVDPSSSRVGIGTNSPTSALQISGTSPVLTLGDFSDGTLGAQLRAYSSGSAFDIANVGSGFTNFYGGATGRMTVTNAGLFVGGVRAPSATLQVSGAAIISSWTAVGFGSNYTPTAPLEVSGTVSATRFTGAFVGDGSGLTNIGGASADRIVSGTTSMLAISTTGYISLTQAGTNTGWFDPTRGLVTIGVSSTGAISGTRGYFSDYVQFTNYLGMIGGPVLTISGGTPLVRAWTAGTPLAFAGGNAGAHEAMRIVSSGMVGIGTISPTNTMEINGSLSISGNGWYGSNPGMHFYNDGTTNWILALNPTVAWMPLSMKALTFTLANSSGTAGLYMDNNGNIGISNTSPNAKLDVNGTVSATSAVIGSIGTGNLNASGAVGIGTVSPSTKLDVSGSILSRPVNNGSATAIDWSQGNAQYTSASCGALTFTNMVDGGVYTLAIKGTTTGTCSFSQSGLTYRMPSNHGATTGGTMTLYSFQRLGTDVFVTWTPGY
jgi:hypothetical protein